METNPEPIKEILEELFSLLESLETQSLALTQFLKDQGIATDEKLVPYLDRAGNASSVKWRAARARMQYLLSPIPKGTTDKEKDKNKDENKDQNKEPEKSSTEKPQTEKPPTEKSTEQNKPESSDATKGTARNTATNANPDKKRQPVTEDNAKKSDTPQKSNRE